MRDSPRLLVIGGSGELGQCLVKAATAWDVHATYLRQQTDEDSATWHSLDILDRQAVLHLITSIVPQVVIHVAYSDRSRSAEDTDSSFLRKMVTGALNVAAATESASSRLIVMSTDLVFDGHTGNYIETDVPNPIMPYGLAKTKMEAALSELEQDIAIVRTSLILSLEPMGRHIRWIVEGVRRGESLDLFVDEQRSPIWGDELAAALLELAQTDYRGLLHIGGPEIINRHRLGQYLVEMFNLDPRRIVPASSAASGLNRPLDCSLDSHRAYSMLNTKIHSIGLRFGQNTNH